MSEPLSLVPRRGEEWQHHEGERYRILAVARRKDDPQQLLVIYEGRDHVWARRLGDFCGWVFPPSPDTGAKGTPRFTLVRKRERDPRD